MERGEIGPNAAFPDMPDDLYIGLMSGTSMDGIDAVLVRFSNDSCVVEASVSPEYTPDLHARLESLIAET